MKQPLIKNYDELPMFINASTLAQLFGVSRASAYELMSEKNFLSRKYASEEIKFIARNAMLLLWDMDGISVQGIHFSKSDIRYRMFHEMSCDDLDRAIAEERMGRPILSEY